jgi:membrane-associated protease RseP (regulator of RpoE activity)
VFRELAWDRPRTRDRYWLHALLLVLTLLTTTIVGAGLAHSFDTCHPSAGCRPFDFDPVDGYKQMWHNPAYLLGGLPFSLTLLLILLAHEMGHYLAARYYRVDASLPFFIPAPTLIGTLGAFIRIRSAILSKRILFDIGIGGPLAGFAMLLLPMAIGVSMSKIVPGIATRGDVLFGTPLVLRLFEWMIFPHSPASDIYLHPVARAAWVGLLATALNLLPIGQLDGGHILYSFLGERTRILSRVFVAALAALGGVQLFTSEYRVGYMWLLWAVVLLFVGMRHPSIVDPSRLGRTRNWLGFAALIIFLLTFTLAPIRTAGTSEPSATTKGPNIVGQVPDLPVGIPSSTQGGHGLLWRL